ncbi:primosomal replication protein N'' [Vibrio cholerae]|nr:primosomal replication protein N'' [Vibrio cholerae]
MSTPSIPLNEASDEIKLAVDLIFLLESHAIEPQIALAALEIVKRDFEQKLADAAVSPRRLASVHFKLPDESLLFKRQPRNLLSHFFGCFRF